MQKVRWLEVQSVEENVVFDLETMLEIDKGSGKTSCVQRVEKVSHIGNLQNVYLFARWLGVFSVRVSTYGSSPYQNGHMGTVKLYIPS